MDLDFTNKVKRLSIVAMVSDDTLLDMLVLKGGNAIDLVYKISERASFDIDFSIENDFIKEDLENIKIKIKRVLTDTFLREGLHVFNITFTEKPEKIYEKIKNFWGGYKIGFKVISEKLYKTNNNDINYLRRNAFVIGPEQKRNFEIDISKYEYCTNKEAKELDYYTVYVYTPEMIVFEKIRAICQQTQEYRKITKSTVSPRSRDFFDIYILMENFSIDLNDKENKELLIIIFETKKVPIHLLKEIRNYKSFHEQDYPSLKDTVKPGVSLEAFSFYFDYVINKYENIFP